MARYSEKQKAALDALMKDDVYTHAMKIITADGINSLTMERLATDVGVSRGTLYNYFDDKDAVTDYLEERTFGPVLAAIQEVVAGDLSADVKLRKIVEGIFTTVSNDHALVVALMPKKLTGAARPCQQQHKARLLDAVVTVLKEGVETDIFKEFSPVLTGHILLGAIKGIIESMADSGEFLPANDIVPTMMGIILEGMRNTN